MNYRGKLMLIIAGPTAVGKTAAAITVANHFGTEIISADSRQFYKGPKIGTAAPTKEELAAATHHFVANLELDQYYNVSIFEQEALKKTDEIFARHNIVIVTGGSGLYINALCHGIDELPDADDELRDSIKNNYETRGIEWLREEVERLDPEYYEIVDIKNPKRLMRALEVCLATGKTYTSLRKSTRKERPFPILKVALNLPREELFDRINKRVDMMIESGLLEEAKRFYPQRHLNSLNTVGYKELFRYLDGEITLKRAVEDIKTNTRRYAKRQITWFKKDPDFRWFSPYETDKIIKLTEEKIKEG
jgi:tRNA dimethylallyltransferase